MPSCQLLDATRLVGLPGVTAGALPIEMPCLEATHAAGIAIEPLRVFVYERAQQTKVGIGGHIGAGGRIARSQLDFEQAVQTEQGGMRAQGVTGKLPRG